MLLLNVVGEGFWGGVYMFRIESTRKTRTRAVVWLLAGGGCLVCVCVCLCWLVCPFFARLLYLADRSCRLFLNGTGADRKQQDRPTCCCCLLFLCHNSKVSNLLFLRVCCIFGRTVLSAVGAGAGAGQGGYLAYMLYMNRVPAEKGKVVGRDGERGRGGGGGQ